MPWILDNKLSSLNFNIRHLLGTVKGQFLSFSTENISFDQYIFKQLDLFILAESIDTGHKTRNEHLRSPDFFDAPAYPFLKFFSTGIESDKTGLITVLGSLFIKDMPIPMAIECRLVGAEQIFEEIKTVHYKIRAELSRKLANLSWNGLTEDGEVILGDKIEITGEIYLTHTQYL